MGGEESSTGICSFSLSQLGLLLFLSKNKEDKVFYNMGKDLSVLRVKCIFTVKQEKLASWNTQSVQCFSNARSPQLEHQNFVARQSSCLESFAPFYDLPCC